MNVIITQEKLAENRIESFWYDGQIAIVETERFTYALIAAGDKSVYFEEEGDNYRGHKAVEEASYRELNDDDIKVLFDNDMFGNNNWFEIVGYDKNDNNNVLSVDCDVAYEYDEGIEMLKSYVEGEIYEKEL